MVLRALEESEIIKIYENRMPNDFARGEIKPLKRILELHRQGKYFCYGLFDGEEFDGKNFDGENYTGKNPVGYCFLVVSKQRDAVLLDYFAIFDKLRGKGLGSICLGLLKEEIERRKFGTLILEVENPRFGKDEEEKELRRRRIAFYVRNGMTLTHLRIFLYDVEYLVMTEKSREMFLSAKQIYHTYQVLLKPDKIDTRLRISTNIRCFAMDLDRTALGEDGRLSLRTKAAILKALDKGIHVIAASGRAYETLPEDITAIDGIEYAISSNGAAVWHKGACIRRNVIGRKAGMALLEVYERAKQEFPVAMEVFWRGKAFCGKEYFDAPGLFGVHERAVQYVQRTREAVEDIKKFAMEHIDELESIAFVSGDREGRERLRRKLASGIEDIFITSSIEHLIEIAGRDVSKGESLKWLLKELYIEPEECMAFGDGDNDAEMLAFAGIGIAVENASQLAKNAANFVTKAHFQDGVAIIMEEILQNT